MSESVEYWCYVELSLSDVFARFQKVLPVAEFIHDAENVWEWFEGNSIDGRVGFNISRKHDQFEDLYSEPVRFSLLLHDPGLNEETLGRMLVVQLETRVFAGEVKYLEGNKFCFLESRSFDPAD